MLTTFELIENDAKRNFIAGVLEVNELNYGAQIDHKVCSKCGGKCCLKGGCELLPCDIKEISVKAVMDMLETDKYTIGFRYFEGGKCYPVLQVREVREGVKDGKIANTLFHNKCALLKTEAPYCPFDDNERPTVAQLLIPHRDGKCKQLINDEIYTVQWLRVINIMAQVVYSLTSKSFQAVYVEICRSDAKKIMQKLEEINFEQLSASETVAVLLCILSGETSGILDEVKQSLTDMDEDIKKIDQLLRDLFPKDPVDMAKIMLELFSERIGLTETLKILLNIFPQYTVEVVKNLYAFQKVFETILEDQQLAVEIEASLRYFEILMKDR